MQIPTTFLTAPNFHSGCKVGPLAQRIAVAPIGEHELALGIRAVFAYSRGNPATTQCPQDIGRLRGPIST